MFRVLVFGSASAPTVWGRFAAWLGRSAAAVAPASVRLQVYVDDPLYTVKGTGATAARDLSVALLWALAAGFPLSLGKTTGGSTT